MRTGRGECPMPGSPGGGTLTQPPRPSAAMADSTVAATKTRGASAARSRMYSTMSTTMERIAGMITSRSRTAAFLASSACASGSADECAGVGLGAPNSVAPQSCRTHPVRREQRR